MMKIKSAIEYWKYKISKETRDVCISLEMEEYLLPLLSLAQRVEEEGGIEKIIDETLPCTCIDAYKDRGLGSPDCPSCNFKEDVATAIRNNLKGNY